MDRQWKEQLADEIFRVQPNMLGSILVLPNLGVSMEKVEFALGVLLVCFQAMKDSGLAWPVITEAEQARQLARFVSITRLGEDIGDQGLQLAALGQGRGGVVKGFGHGEWHR